MEEIKIEEIGEILKGRIKGYEREIVTSEVGTVISVGDGIARAYGLSEAMAGELVEFQSGIMGLVLNLEEVRGRQRRYRNIRGGQICRGRQYGQAHRASR